MTAAFRRLHGLSPQTITGPGSSEASALALARHHRVVGLLYADDTAQNAALRQAALGQMRHVTRFTHEAERLFAQLHATLPHVTLFKGPALACQGWPTPGLRTFDDLDFLCARQDYAVLCATLRDAGYAPYIADERRRSHYWHFGWGLAFKHPEGYRIEAKHRFFPPHYPTPISHPLRDAALFTHVRLDTQSVRVPAPALHLLLTCSHAVWHGMIRWSWILDIAGLLLLHPDAWKTAQALTRPNSFARRALHTACAVAQQFVGADILDARPHEADPDAVAYVLQKSLYAPPPATMHDQALYGLLMTRWEYACFRGRQAFTPGDGDFRRWNLPENMRAAYWALRPLRILCTRI